MAERIFFIYDIILTSVHNNIQNLNGISGGLASGLGLMSKSNRQSIDRLTLGSFQSCIISGHGVGSVNGIHLTLCSYAILIKTMQLCFRNSARLFYTQWCVEAHLIIIGHLRPIVSEHCCFENDGSTSGDL